MASHGEWSIGLFACGLVVACSSSSNTANPVDSGAPDSGQVSEGGSGPMDTGSGTDTGTVMTACNTLANTAPVVHIDLAPGATPKPTGGTVPDGTYYATKYDVYGAPGAGDAGATTANTYQAVSVLKSGTYNLVVATNGAVPQAVTGTITESGTAIMLEQTCPSPSPVPFAGYSSDGTKVVSLIGTPGLQGTAVITFTKQ
jgi:hypothetical protein